MALFRSNRGMHLLALPTTHADAENTRRKNIQDGGTTTASRLLAQARILPQEALVCGPPGRIFSAVETLLQVLPSYESERVTNSIGFNTHHDRGGMMGRHGGSGFSFGQNREVVTKPVLSQDDLTGLRNNSEFLVYNQDLMRLWVGKIG